MSENYAWENLSKEDIIEDLTSYELYMRAESWINIDSFISNKLISKNEARSIRNKLIELLSSNNKKVRWKAWGAALKAADKRIIIKEDSSKFIDLLKYEDYGVRGDAWENIYPLLKIKIIKKRDIPALADKLVETIISDNIEASLSAYLGMFYINRRRMLTKRQFESSIKRIFEFLKSENADIRHEAWIFVAGFGNMDKRTVRRNAFKLFEILSSENVEVRLDAWDFVDLLVSRKKIPKKKFIPFLDKLYELVGSDDDDVRNKAWGTLLYSFPKIIRKNASTLLDLLGSDNKKVRLDTWGRVESLLDNIVIRQKIPKKRFIPFLDKLYELAGSDDDDVRNKAWGIVRSLTPKIIKRRNASTLLDLLGSDNVKVRLDTWHNVLSLANEHRILRKSQLIFPAGKLLELLRSEDGDIRKSAWEIAVILEKKHIIEPNKLDPFRKMNSTRQRG